MRSSERRIRWRAITGVSRHSDCASCLAKFDCQLVPESLFHFDQFSNSYKGLSTEEISKAWIARLSLVRLPQLVHVASGVAFSRRDAAGLRRGAFCRGPYL